MVDPQQDEYAANRGKQYMGFTQRIKGTVIQNHTGDVVDSTGLLNAIVDVAQIYLVGIGRVVRAKGRQIGNCPDQNTDQNDAGKYREDAVDGFKRADLQQRNSFRGIL